VPVSAARAMGAEIVIAANLSSDVFAHSTTIYSHGPSADAPVVSVVPEVVPEPRKLGIRKFFSAERTMKREFFGGSREPEAVVLGGVTGAELIRSYNVDPRELDPYLPADDARLKQVGTTVHYLGYYLKWDPQECYYYAAEHTGFAVNDERTEGSYSKYSSIDDRIDPVHYYTTYIKFGIGRATYDAAQEIRTRKITREEGVALRHGAQQEVQDLYEANFWLGKRGEFFRQRLKRSRDSNRATLDALQPLWDTYSKLGAMSELDRVALNGLIEYVRGPGPAAVHSYVRKERLIIPPAGNSDRTATIVKYLSDLHAGTARRQRNLDNVVQARWSAWMPKFRKTVCGAELAKASCSSPADVNDLPAFIIQSERLAQSGLTR